MTDRFVQANGLRLHYLDWGNDGAPALLMLHGANNNAHVWDSVAGKLADRYHVLALDQRGRGDSDWSPDADYYTDAYVSDVEQWVDQLGLRAFILMGHSMGGANTIVYASRHPDRVRAAVVEDMGPRPLIPSPAGGNLRLAREQEDPPMEFATWEAARAYWRKERPLTSDESVNLRVRNTMKQLPNGKFVWRYDVQGLQRARQNADPSRQVDLWPHTRSIQCPTLVLRGAASDVLARETAEAMARANSHIRWVEVPGASHSVHDDNPDFFNRELQKFLGGLV
ncbi:MAG: alpha/beta hydrolase [Chloroflexi bacterium]|nr:alpha/beta hydrolase [Chloroflexota bacterium]